MRFEKKCGCASDLYALGQMSCVPEVTRDSYKIYVHYYDSTGAINAIPEGTVLDEDFIEGKLNNTDHTKRWYITPKIENQVAASPEKETESIGNQTYMTGEEIKQPETFEHVKKTGNPALLAFYDEAGCVELGEYTITRTGQVTGMNDGNGNLLPVRLQDDSLQATYAKPVSGTTQKVMVSRTDDELENDANRDFIDSSNIEYSALLWYAKSPIEILARIIGTPSTTAVVFKLDGMFGGFDGKANITGVVTADMVSTDDAATGELYNVTEEANEAGTLTYDSVTEQYTFTYSIALDAATDVIDLAITKTGYSFKTIQYHG